MIQPNSPTENIEPLLPGLPESFMAKKPQLSGACPSKATLLMYLVGLPISFAIGVLSHYVGIIVGYVAGAIATLPNLLASVCGVVLCAFAIFAIVVIIGAFLGYPFVVGYLGGMVVGELGKKGLCRNAKIAAWAGILNAIFIYIGHSVIAAFTYGGLHPMTVTVKMFNNVFDASITGTPWWMTILVLIEFAMVLIGAFQGGKQTISDAAFCEEHQQWYSKWKQAIFSAQSIEPIALAIQEEDPQFLDPVVLVPAETYPHVIIKARSCPSSSECELELKGDVFWQIDKVDKKGQKTKENKSKSWFDVMVPAVFGHQVEEKLNLKELAMKKKGKK